MSYSYREGGASGVSCGLFWVMIMAVLVERDCEVWEGGATVVSCGGKDNPAIQIVPLFIQCIPVLLGASATTLH